MNLSMIRHLLLSSERWIAIASSNVYLPVATDRARDDDIVILPREYLLLFCLRFLISPSLTFNSRISNTLVPLFIAIFTAERLWSCLEKP